MQHLWNVLFMSSSGGKPGLAGIQAGIYLAHWDIVMVLTT